MTLRNFTLLSLYMPKNLDVGGCVSIERMMDRKQTIGSPFSRMLTPVEAFAEAEYKTTLYGLEGLLLGACQILYGHFDIQRLTDLERMELAAYIRPAISEIEDYLKKDNTKQGFGRLKQ